MAVIGQYKCEIQLNPGPNTLSYRIVVEGYHLGSTDSGPNVEQDWQHTYDWNVGAASTPESHILRQTDQDLSATVPTNPSEALFFLPDIGANVLEVTLTPYDAVEGAKGSGTAGDPQTLYLGTPASSSLMRAENVGGDNIVAPTMKGTGGITMTFANSVIEVDGSGAGGASTLAGLTDTTISSSPGVGEYLRHDGTDWKNAAITEGDITDGTLLARLAGTETITGAWLFSTSATVGDDVAWQFGSGTDYWMKYNSTGTQFEFWTTNADGAGADGLVFTVDDGTDDVTFTGVITPLALEVGATPASAGSVRLTNNDEIYWRNFADSADLGFYVGLDDELTVNTHLRPSGNGTLTLGTSDERWQTLYTDAIVGVSFVTSVSEATNGGITVNPTSGAVLVGIRLTGTDNYIIEAPDLRGTGIGTTARVAYSDASNNVQYGNVSDLPFTNNTGDVESVANATNGGLAVTDGGGPDVTLALAVDDLADFSALDSMDATDRFAVHEAGQGTRKIDASKIPLSIFDNNLTLTAEDIGPGVFNTTGGTYDLPNSSLLRFGDDDASTAKIQFGNRAAGLGHAYVDVVSVTAEDELDIGFGSWNVDILGATVKVNGSAIVTSVTGTSPISVTAGATPDVSLTLATDSGLQNNSGLDLDIVSLGSPVATSPTTLDSLAFHLDGSDTKRILFGSVNLSSFNNDLTAIVTSVDQASTQGGGSASGLTITGTSAVLAGIMYAGGGAQNLFNAAPQWVDETLVGTDELLVGDAGDALAVPFEQIPVSLFDTGNFVESDVDETITGNWTFPNTTDIGVTVQSYDTLAATDWDRGVGTHVFVNAGASTGEPSGAGRGYWFTMGRRDTLSGYAGLYLESNNTLWIGQRDDNSTDGAPTWVEVANVGHEHSATDITSGTLSVAQGGTGLTAEVGNDELLVSKGSGSGYEGSVALTYNSSTGLNLAGTGLDISITGTGRFEGNGSGLINVPAGALTLQTPDPTTGTYYPLLTPDSAGDAAVYVDSSDLRWNATDSQLLTADGANGSPSFSFISDPDTGMLLDAVGTLALTTAGAVRLDVSSTAIEAVGIPFRATASTSGHFGHSSFSAATYLTSNLYYDGSGDPNLAANWRYISAAGGSNTAGWALQLKANGAETGQSVRLFSVPTSTGAAGTPASFTERLRITSAQMLFGDGTQADPAYSFIDDDDTGMYLSSPGNLTFATSATDRLNFNGTDFEVVNVTNMAFGSSTGWVDNTSTSVDQFQIGNLSGNWGILGRVGNGSAFYIRASDDNTSVNGGLRLATTGSNALEMNGSAVLSWTGSAITAHQDVVMSANETHDIGSSTARVNDIWSSVYYVKRANSSPTIQAIRDDATIADGNTLLQITGKGDLGSGTAWGADIVMSADQTWVQGSDSGARISFRTNANDTWNTPVERMRIDHDGQVGIGTTDPLTLLHLSSAAGENMLRLQDTGGTGSTANPYIDFYDSAARIGYIGFGSTGNGHLYINNDIASGDIWLQTESGGEVQIYSAASFSDPTLIFRNTDGEKGYLKVLDNGDLTLATAISNAQIHFRADGNAFNMMTLDFDAAYMATIRGDTQILGNLNLLYDGTVMQRMTNDDVSLTDKSWDIRIADTTGVFEIRSVQDNGTTVQTPLQIAHATGNVQVNTQFAVKEEQTTLTVAPTVNCDWDLSNQLHLTISSTVTTINIDDTAMVAGGSYILIVQEGTSAPDTVNWSSGTVILWANNNEPILNGGDSGDMTVVQFFKTTAGDDHIIGSWFLAQ